MLQSIIFYLLVSKTEYKVFEDYQVFSTHPISECVGYIEINRFTNERAVRKLCKTERLYFLLTGIDVIEIHTTGIYNT